MTFTQISRLWHRRLHVKWNRLRYEVQDMYERWRSPDSWSSKISQKGIPFMITEDMTKKLEHLGYSPSSIKAMTPTQAVHVIHSRTKFIDNASIGSSTIISNAIHSNDAKVAQDNINSNTVLTAEQERTAPMSLDRNSAV